MTAPLPAHVATADEQIPPPSDHPLINEPDMRAVTPIKTMLAELAHVADDDVAFVQQFRAFVREIGCTVMAHYDREGDLGLSLGSPVDAQVRHRSRWMHYLVERLDAADGRRELLLRNLIDERVCWDERPADPSETTEAVRGFLRVGGRLLINPDGRLEEGGGVPPAMVTGTAEEADDCIAASRRYFAARHRFRADRQIRRAVSMLGRRTANGWLVLEASR